MNNINKKDFVNKNILLKSNVFNNILVPFSKGLNIKLNEFIVKDCVKTMTKDIDFDYILEKCEYDVAKINIMIINVLMNKYGVSNNKYNDKTDEFDYVMSIMKNTLDDDSSFSATRTYDEASSYNAATASDTSSMSNFSTQNLIQIAKILNLDSLKRSAKAYVNSRYKNIITNDNTSISFNLVNKRSTNQLSGDLPLGINIKNIIGFKIPSFTIPMIDISANSGMVYLCINEIQTDGFTSFSDIVCHFVFKYTEWSPNSYMLTPEFDGEIDFINPLNINSLTFRFSDGFSYLPLPSESIRSVSINYSDGNIVFNEHHNLLSGDIVYITDFNTLNPTTDYVLINKINATSGVTVNRIDAFTIQLAGINLSDIRFPDSSVLPHFYCNNRIIQFPLVIKYINDTTF
jgi:hypothetical protein